jgi:membrane protein DedA with SNARE-associated domain
VDCVIENEWLAYFLLEYGSISLFFLLILGIIALPIPEETLMIFSGILMNKGNMAIFPTFIAALAGSMCGITVSYFLGTSVGKYVLERYGPWFGIKEARLHKAKEWFLHYGQWTLIIGYFIPGVRHLTGVTAGLSELPYKRFAIFAYTGALLWVSTFLSIGYFFSDACFTVFEIIDNNLDNIMQIAIFLAIVYIAVRIVFKLKKNRNKT